MNLSSAIDDASTTGVPSEPRRSSGKGTQFRHSLGRFVLDDLAPRSYFLRVLADGYELHETALELASAEDRRLDIELSHGEGVSGRLIDRAGRPEAGARVFPVTAEELGKPIQRRGGSFHTFRYDGMPYAESFERAWAEEVRTDSGGRFVLSGMPRGPLLLRVEHGDFLFEDLPGLDVPAGGIELGTVELVRGSTLEGAVFDADGLPMRSSSIELTRLREDETEARDKSVYFQVEKDGRFSKSGLRAGRYRLRVHGLAELDQFVDLGADETERVEFHLPARE